MNTAMYFVYFYIFVELLLLNLMQITEHLCVLAGQSRSELSTDGTDGEKHKYHKLKSLTPYTDNVILSLQRQITDNFDRRKTFEVRSRRIST